MTNPVDPNIRDDGILITPPIVSNTVQGWLKNIYNALISGITTNKTKAVSVTPPVTAANAYGINYVVGGLLTFPNAFTATGSGILQSVYVNMKKVETSGFTFIPFSANPVNSTFTDAAVCNINAADFDKVRGPISLGQSNAMGTHTIAAGIGLGEALSPGGTTLYGVLLANAALTNQFSSTGDVSVTVAVLQDP